MTNEKREFPDLIKAGLKVGDTVYSYLYGKGLVESVAHDAEYPIFVSFASYSFSLTAEGFCYKTDLMPIITLTPWNPIAGEPFPFPKWEPIVGEAYAFWDKVGSLGYVTNRYREKTPAGYYADLDGRMWYNCAPISDAMQIFGFDKPQQP